jgi:signal transduction histidine kinase
MHTFNTKTERLETDERQRRELLADISHELRTPLTVLQGEIEAIMDGVHPADDAHLTRVLDEAHVLARLIDDLRTLTLAEAGTLLLHREPVDLGVLAAETAAAFETAATRAGVRIEVSSEADAPILNVDPIRMREVLANLVSNALRYAPAGTSVRVEVATDANAGRVAFTVRDEGPGIAPEVRARLFERFSKSTESRGSGLGLAIARSLVEAHGGTIRADAANGHGTVMRVEIPLDQVTRS